MERSKEEAPSWTRLDADRLYRAGDMLQTVVVGDELRALPAGLKDTQLTALQSHELRVLDSVEAQIEAWAKQAPGLQWDRQAAQSMIKQATHGVHGEAAKVADIYYEKLRGDSFDYYRAFVLVRMPADRLPLIFTQVSQKMLASKDSNLQQLGRLVASSNNASTPTGH